MKTDVLRTEERIMLMLRELYRSRGYIQYKVSKFEEYDLYMQNKNFLTSEKILTFSDTNGHLMALKPDVTLSIIKNTKDEGGSKKLFYSENVYRVPRNSYGFREIMQTGLELMGLVDRYATCEVLTLAAESLKRISEKYVLDVSHVGVISGILAGESLTDGDMAEIVEAIGGKNPHALSAVCRRCGVSAQGRELLSQLVSVSGPLSETIEKMKALPLPGESEAAIHELEELGRDLAAGGEYNVNLDFSVVNDMDYYSGIVFRGFVEGVPAGVLSGGRYDNLMAKMGKRSGAIGFAVYLDQLERFMEKRDEFDVDTLLLYNDSSDIGTVIKTAGCLAGSGETVRVQRDTDGVAACRRRLFVDGTEVRDIDA